MCIVLLGTLQKAMRHIKTGFGRSDDVYGNEQIPISGCGQGNGIGPTLWALISTILFRMMTAKDHGVTFLCLVKDPHHACRFCFRG